MNGAFDADPSGHGGEESLEATPCRGVDLQTPVAHIIMVVMMTHKRNMEGGDQRVQQQRLQFLSPRESYFHYLSQCFLVSRKIRQHEIETPAVCLAKGEASPDGQARKNFFDP